MKIDKTDEWLEKIKHQREKRKAVILAHNYQLGEVQDIADFVGDSLDLARRAAATDAEVIVFCGVHFMAETAAILSPDKIVLLPAMEAGCPMADMVDAQSLRQAKARNPNAMLVCYVNSSAEVKAECDICCTSANADKILGQIPADREIIFVPDQYLGSYAGKVAHREITLWPGYCPTHQRILPRDLHQLQRQFPEAKIIVHPECRSEVVRMADAVLSTGGMCDYVQKSAAQTFIVGTEIGIMHRLRKENPGKRFIPATEQAVCPNMKQITLEKILWSLEEMQHPIKVEENIRVRAVKAVERMLAVK